MTEPEVDGDGASGVAGVASRRVAIDAVAQITADNSYANLKLDPILTASGLDERDRRFVTELVYGTIRRRRSLDYLADRFLSSDPPPEARAALRVGAYQLQFTDVPDHAAVSTTVSAAAPRFRGLVNAILRKIAGADVVWPDEATRLSYPDWLVDRVVADLGHDDAIAALEVMNQAPDVTVRDDGYTQDLASQWVADLVDVADGSLVVDLCAAPGGKATAMAAAGALVIAADRRVKRAGMVAGNAQRVGADSVWALVADGRAPAIRSGLADRVLVDAPCSGLGVLRRRPDARWRIGTNDIVELAVLQRSLLDAALPLVAPGGVLVYSVCTLTRDETIGVAEGFAAAHLSLVAEPFPGEPWRPWGDGAILLPQDADTDGMCVFRWRVPLSVASDS